MLQWLLRQKQKCGVALLPNNASMCSILLVAKFLARKQELGTLLAREEGKVCQKQW